MIHEIFRFGTIAILALSSINGVARAEEGIELPQQECSISGEFTQAKHLSGLPEPLLSSGVFFFHCDHGVIWKTLDPVDETLVFSRHGTSFLLQDDDIQPLKSRQAKFLGELLNTLIGAKTEEVSQQFELSSIPSTDEQSDKPSGTATYRLIPRDRSIKRAVKQISLLFSEYQLDQKPSVSISVVDRNDQQTDIKSTREEVYSEQDDPRLHCQQQASIGADECSLLLPINAG